MDQRLHLETEVVQEGGVVLAKGLLVVADLAVEAHAFKEGQIEPGLQPGPYTKAPGEFPEGLCPGVAVGHILVERSTLLFRCLVQQGIGVEFQRERSGLHQAFV